MHIFTGLIRTLNSSIYKWLHNYSTTHTGLPPSQRFVLLHLNYDLFFRLHHFLSLTRHYNSPLQLRDWLRENETTIGQVLQLVAGPDKYISIEDPEAPTEKSGGDQHKIAFGIALHRFVTCLAHSQYL